MITYEHLTAEELEQMEARCLILERADMREREMLEEGGGSSEYEGPYVNDNMQSDFGDDLSRHMDGFNDSLGYYDNMDVLDESIDDCQ